MKISKCIYSNKHQSLASSNILNIVLLFPKLAQLIILNNYIWVLRKKWNLDAGEFSFETKPEINTFLEKNREESEVEHILEEREHFAQSEVSKESNEGMLFLKY